MALVWAYNKLLGAQFATAYHHAFTIQNMHASAISPPQLKHQYIDYTNGSSIVSGQKIHVDFDYGNGLDCRWLRKAVFCIEACLLIPIQKCMVKK